MSRRGKIQKLTNEPGGISASTEGKMLKINKRACSFIRYLRVGPILSKQPMFPPRSVSNLRMTHCEGTLSGGGLV